MNLTRQIRDHLIDAVRIDREMHEHVGPKRLRGQQLAYVHDFIDKNGWGKVPGDKKCQLAREDGDPHKQVRVDFWEQYNREPSGEEIAQADAVHGWLSFVDKPEERRALRGWLHSKVGGKSFRRWCMAVEGISTQTGRRRKDKALAKIEANLVRRNGTHDVSGILGELLLAHEISDHSDTIAEGADDGEGLNHWRSSDAPGAVQIIYQSHRSGDRRVVAPASEFNWARKRNERRKKQLAKAKAKREAEAAAAAEAEAKQAAKRRQKAAA